MTEPTQVDHREVGPLNPVATIYLPPGLLCNADFQFDEDEWGAHTIAAFRPDGSERAIAVVRYNQEPNDTAHLFATGDIAPADVADVVAGAALALGLPHAAFQWRATNGEMATLVETKPA